MMSTRIIHTSIPPAMKSLDLKFFVWIFSLEEVLLVDLVFRNRNGRVGFPYSTEEMGGGGGGVVQSVK